jgi:hypothetical protein
MSYRRSRARREFETQVDQAMKELAPLYKFAQKQGGHSRLLAAYYVFSYSQLEVFIKSLVEDALNTLNISAPPFNKLPDLMLAYLLHKSEKLAADYRRYTIDEDEGAILKKVAKTARKIASWSAGTAGLTAADAADFLEKKKYPSPNNLPQLFRRLGVEQIWAMVGKAGKINGELILTSLNDLRTEIAHEGRIPPGFSLADFRDRLSQMRRFVAALDRGLSTHFCSALIPRTSWNVTMG